MPSRLFKSGVFSRWLRLFGGAGLVCVACLSAQATTFVQLSLEQMTGYATRIVEARALESHSEWNAEHTRIFTYTTFEVLDSLKGEGTGERLVIKQLGGHVGHLVMHVDGEPQFRAGEEAVLFLAEDREEPARERIVGMAQGSYRVRREPGTNRGYVTRSPEGAVYFDPRRQSFTELSERLPLEEFKQRVRQILSGRPQPSPDSAAPRQEK